MKNINEKIKNKNIESGFSLAEVMVLLTLVAIMLALSAPLISRPANTDPQHLLKKGVDNEIIVANGNYQVLNVGMNNSDKLKLKVRGANTYNGDKSLKDRAQSGLFSGILRISGSGNKLAKVDENGFAMIKGDESDENTLFRIKPNGDIYLQQIPGISASKYYRLCASSTEKVVLPEDGYLYINNAKTENNNINFTINTSDSTPTELSYSNSEISFNKKIKVNQIDDIDANSYRPASEFPIFYPVQKGLEINCEQRSALYFFPLEDETFNIDEQSTKHNLIQILPQ